MLMQLLGGVWSVVDTPPCLLHPDLLSHLTHTIHPADCKHPNIKVAITAVIPDHLSMPDVLVSVTRSLGGRGPRARPSLTLGVLKSIGSGPCSTRRRHQWSLKSLCVYQYTPGPRPDGKSPALKSFLSPLFIDSDFPSLSDLHGLLLMRPKSSPVFQDYTLPNCPIHCFVFRFIFILIFLFYFFACWLHLLREKKRNK